MSEGVHPFPSRTRQLSPPEPMVLGTLVPGRVGRRQINFKASPFREALFFLFSLPSIYVMEAFFIISRQKTLTSKVGDECRLLPRTYVSIAGILWYNKSGQYAIKRGEKI